MYASIEFFVRIFPRSKGVFVQGVGRGVGAGVDELRDGHFRLPHDCRYYYWLFKKD